jgi:hypothetical protein
MMSRDGQERRLVPQECHRHLGNPAAQRRAVILCVALSSLARMKKHSVGASRLHCPFYIPGYL